MIYPYFFPIRHPKQYYHTADVVLELFSYVYFLLLLQYLILGEKHFVYIFCDIDLLSGPLYCSINGWIV